MLVNNRTVGQRVHFQIKTAGQLVLRNQTYRQQYSIAFDIKFGTRNRSHTLVNLSNGDTGYALFTMDSNDGVGEVQRNIIVVQTLNDITGKTVGEGADFQASLNLAAFQAHTASHNQADVAAAEDNDFVTRQIAFHINHTLSSAGSENASRTLARNTDSATGTLTAAHGQDNSFAFQLQ